ncbi:hypothetical protein H2509_16705 [Stappia sp. F7233]|uniref:Cobalamin biosynthesis protein CbiX n=1 Tax=Stappia albiluteola TaxID=2758565 RepID=A0A839AJ24_9HYPH|nr:CbiX/SirB N-terminal domain-containing protein [Stappia albiluteola]MBA5778767.1 hypothetical protein [Stappia albiluteola]
MQQAHSPHSKQPAHANSNVDPADQRPVLLLVAHGAGDFPGANDGIVALASRIGGRLPELDVRTAVLNGRPDVEAVVRDIGPDRDVTVYPHFLSDGYFVRDALPKRLAGLRQPVRMLSPLGLMPGLASIAAHALRRALGPGALPPIVVVSHGSAVGARPRGATLSFAKSLRRALGGPQMACTFLEEEPLFEEKLGAIEKDAAVIRFFAANGGHAEIDVAKELRKRGHTGFVSDPVGLMPGVGELVARNARSAERRSGL